MLTMTDDLFDLRRGCPCTFVYYKEQPILITRDSTSNNYIALAHFTAFNEVSKYLIYVVIIVIINPYSLWLYWRGIRLLYSYYKLAPIQDGCALYQWSPRCYGNWTHVYSMLYVCKVSITHGMNGLEPKWYRLMVQPNGTA
jgi:hypothetical protein